MSLIQLKSIDISFGGPKLLEGINLSIDPLERISLVGRNGAGKSSLLKIINGELLPDSGEIIKSKDLKITRLDQNVPTTFKGNIFQVVSQGLLSNEKYYKDYQKV